MHKKNTTIAKISRPNISGVFARKRLFTLLDDCRKRSVVWVSGPAGSGKTTFVSSYLDERKLPCLWYQADEGDADIASFFYYLCLAARKAAPRNRKPLPFLTTEYLHGVSIFARRYFENLYSRFKPPYTLVFDNYQDVPAESHFHEIMQEALTSVPDGVTVILISRSEPGPAFARLRTLNAMSFIGWEDLKFSLEEARKLSRAGKNQLPDAVMAQVYRFTEGWAAGIVLMLEQLRTTAPNRMSIDNFTREEIFHYFAGEIFEKADRETQQFLLMSACLPTMTVPVVQELTGNEASHTILAELSRNHFFTDRRLSADAVYQYHPLFREFLLFRADRVLSVEMRIELRKKAALLLEKNSQAEQAADLLSAAGAWDELARLINTWAQALISQGRTQTLEGWLSGFPESYRENNPWLKYWIGACRLPFNPAESQRYFEHAFELFNSTIDPAGLFLSWSGVMEAIFLGWGEFTQADRWISLLDDLMQRHPLFPSPEIDARVTTSMLFALTLRQPHHRHIRTWADRARAIAQKSTNIRLKSFISVYLELYYLWIGDHAGAEFVIKGVRESAATPDASPLAQILGRIIEAVYQVRMGSHDLCRKAVVEGLDIASKTGVVIWNSQLYSQGAINALSEGKPSEAAEYLKKMEPAFVESRRIDACMYRYNTAWEALVRRDLSRARHQVEEALRLALEAGTPFHEGITRIALAQVLHEQGEDEAAMPQLSQALRIAGRMKSRILEFMYFLSQAQIALDRGEDSKVLAPLAQAMTLGRKEGYTNFYWWRSDVMSRLCSRALDAGLETGYVHDLIRKRSLMPPGSASDSWPWPLKIFTLGRFELVSNGKPLTFSGKVQQKPLALLKSLIALGGRDVAEEQFADILWPDADGDLAHKSFEMTVQRLRKLIKSDDIIQLQERRLSLDLSRCWVDVWELESLIETVDRAWKNRGPGQALRLSDKALGLYRGHFLPNDSSHPWALSCRERLRSKFIRLIIPAGVHWEQQLQWQKAAEIFQKGIEVDGLAEEFYQHLMVCYQELGRRAEAVSIYNRCRTLLLSSLGIPPSRKTEDLYRSIKN
jgi:ATP/maltotriose-dependent transcriptional regulator MalT/DNA-binding SARP family transcriptional activator